MPLSAAQKLQMQTTVGQLKAQIDALVPDGPVPPVAGVWTDYNGAYFGDRKFQSVLVDVNGQPILSGGQPIPTAAYTSVAATAGKGIARWWQSPTTYSQENYQLATGPDLTVWGVVRAYSDQAGNVYPLETVKAEWIDLATGVVRNISDATGPLGSKSGTVMCPQVLPASGKFRIREWFYTCNPDGSRSNPCYWQEDFEFGVSRFNPAWTTDLDKTRPAIYLSEGWWDPVGGWIRGYSAPGKLPWLAGAPADPGVLTYTGTQALAKGAGSLWVFQYGAVAAQPGFAAQAEYRIALATIV